MRAVNTRRRRGGTLVGRLAIAKPAAAHPPTTPFVRHVVSVCFIGPLSKFDFESAGRVWPRAWIFSLSLSFSLFPNEGWASGRISARLECVGLWGGSSQLKNTHFLDLRRQGVFLSLRETSFLFWKNLSQDNLCPNLPFAHSRGVQWSFFPV